MNEFFYDEVISSINAFVLARVDAFLFCFNSTAAK